MNNLQALARAYRQFLLELGEEFKKVKEEKLYDGHSETFIDCVKSPDIGFTTSEVNTLIKMYDKFCLLEIDDLPSHHAMKIMVNKNVDMDLLTDAQNLSVTDFKERIKDEETGNQDRTYKYEVIARVQETGNIKRVYEETKEEAVSKILEEDFGLDWKKIQQAKDSLSC
jgi:hypothetical protein